MALSLADLGIRLPHREHEIWCRIINHTEDQAAQATIAALAMLACELGALRDAIDETSPRPAASD